MLTETAGTVQVDILFLPLTGSMTGYQVWQSNVLLALAKHPTTVLFDFLHLQSVTEHRHSWTQEKVSTRFESRLKDKAVYSSIVPMSREVYRTLDFLLLVSRRQLLTTAPWIFVPNHYYYLFEAIEQGAGTIYLSKWVCRSWEVQLGSSYFASVRVLVDSCGTSNRWWVTNSSYKLDVTTNEKLCYTQWRFNTRRAAVWITELIKWCSVDHRYLCVMYCIPSWSTMCS